MLRASPTCAAGGKVKSSRSDGNGWTARLGTLTLPDSKNGRGRVLAIAGNLIEIFKRREQARLVETPDGGVKVADYVFHRKGQPLGDFKRPWQAALVKAGFAYAVTVVKKKDGRTLRVHQDVPRLPPHSRP
jgi:hypothetical protein